MLFGCELTSLSCSICGTGGIPYNNAQFGVGTGPIYLDDVACTLSDSQLLECSSRPILTHNCDHHDDAGVKCEGMYFCFLLFTVKALTVMNNATMIINILLLQLLAELMKCD